MFTLTPHFWRKFVPLLFITIFVGYFAHGTTGQQYTLPRPATPPSSATHMLFVTYHNGGGGGSNLHLIPPGTW